MSGRRETKDYEQEDDGLAEAEQGGGWSVDQDRGGGSATDMEVILQRLGSKEYRHLLESELEASRRGEGDLGRIERIVAALAAVDGEEGGDEGTVDELYLGAMADQRQEQAFLSRQGEGGKGGQEVIGDIDLLAAAAFADDEQQHSRDREDPKALAMQLLTAAAAAGEGRYNPFAPHQHHRQQEEGVVDRRVRRNPFDSLSPPTSPMVASASNGIDQSKSESSSPFLLHRGRELIVGDEEDEETEDDEDGYGTQPVPRQRGSVGGRGEGLRREMIVQEEKEERQQQQDAHRGLLLTQYLLERQQQQQELFQQCDRGKGEEEGQQQDTSRSLLLTQFLLERQQHQQELFQQCDHEEGEGEGGSLVGGEVGSPAIAWEEEGRDDEVVVSRREGGGWFDRTYDIVDDEDSEEGKEGGMILGLESVIRQGRSRIGGNQGQGKGEGGGLIGALEQQEHHRRRSSGGPSPPPPFATVDWSAPSPPVPIITKNYSYQRKGLIRGGQAVMTPRGRTNHSDSPSYQAFIERQEFMEETRRSKLKALRQQRDQEVDKSSNTGRWLSRTPTGKALRESQSFPTDPYNDGMTSSYHRRTASSGSQERGRKERMNPVVDCFLERLHRQTRARHKKLERTRTEVLAARAQGSGRRFLNRKSLALLERRERFISLALLKRRERLMRMTSYLPDRSQHIRQRTIDLTASTRRREEAAGRRKSIIDPGVRNVERSAERLYRSPQGYINEKLLMRSMLQKGGGRAPKIPSSPCFSGFSDYESTPVGRSAGGKRGRRRKSGREINEGKEVFSEGDEPFAIGDEEGEDYDYHLHPGGNLTIKERMALFKQSLMTRLAVRTKAAHLKQHEDLIQQAHLEGGTFRPHENQGRQEIDPSYPTSPYEKQKEGAPATTTALSYSPLPLKYPDHGTYLPHQPHPHRHFCFRSRQIFKEKVYREIALFFNHSPRRLSSSSSSAAAADPSTSSSFPPLPATLDRSETKAILQHFNIFPSPSTTEASTSNQQQQGPVTESVVAANTAKKQEEDRLWLRTWAFLIDVTAFQRGEDQQDMAKRMAILHATITKEAEGIGLAGGVGRVTMASVIMLILRITTRGLQTVKRQEPRSTINQKPLQSTSNSEDQIEEEEEEEEECFVLRGAADYDLIKSLQRLHLLTRLAVKASSPADKSSGLINNSRKMKNGGREVEEEEVDDFLSPSFKPRICPKSQAIVEKLKKVNQAQLKKLGLKSDQVYHRLELQPFVEKEIIVTKEEEEEEEEKAREQAQINGLRNIKTLTTTTATTKVGPTGQVAAAAATTSSNAIRKTVVRMKKETYVQLSPDNIRTHGGVLTYLATVKQKRLDWLRERARRQEKAASPFRPTINKLSLQIVQDRRRSEVGEGGEAAASPPLPLSPSATTTLNRFDLLHKQWARIQEKRRVEEEENRLQSEAKEMEGCVFQPNLHQKKSKQSKGLQGTAAAAAAAESPIGPIPFFEEQVERMRRGRMLYEEKKAVEKSKALRYYTDNDADDDSSSISSEEEEEDIEEDLESRYQEARGHRLPAAAAAAEDASSPARRRVRRGASGKKKKEKKGVTIPQPFNLSPPRPRTAARSNADHVQDEEARIMKWAHQLARVIAGGGFDSPAASQQQQEHHQQQQQQRQQQQYQQQQQQQQQRQQNHYQQQQKHQQGHEQQQQQQEQTSMAASNRSSSKSPRRTQAGEAEEGRGGPSPSPLLYVDVVLSGDVGKQRIAVYREDSPRKLSQTFGSQHHLAALKQAGYWRTPSGY